MAPDPEDPIGQIKVDIATIKGDVSAINIHLKDMKQTLRDGHKKFEEHGIAINNNKNECRRLDMEIQEHKANHKWVIGAILTAATILATIIAALISWWPG